MSRKKPKLNITPTSATSADLSFPDWDGEEVYIYRAVGGTNQFELLDTVTANSYTDSTLEAGKIYKYYIRMSDLVSSIVITEDHTDEDPPYYTIGTVGGSALSTVQKTYSIDWTDDLTVNLTRVSNLQQGLSSIGKFTT